MGKICINFLEFGADYEIPLYKKDSLGILKNILWDFRPKRIVCMVDISKEV